MAASAQDQIVVEVTNCRTATGQTKEIWTVVTECHEDVNCVVRCLDCVLCPVWELSEVPVGKPTATYPRYRRKKRL
jgi:hypothetical protein